MRKFFTMTLVWFSLMACKQEKDAFVLQGHLEGLTDKYIYLIHPADADQQLDTLEVKGGKFRFKGTVTTPDMYFLSSESMEKPIEIFLEPGTFKVKGNLADLSSIAVEGGVLQDAYVRYTRHLRPYYDAYVEYATSAEESGLQNQEGGAEAFESQVKKLAKNYYEAALSFLESEPVTMVTAYIIASELLYEPQVNRIDALVAKFDEQARNSRHAQVILANLASARKVMVGSIAPLFSMNDMEGNQIALEKYQGKYVLVDFWASWCKPCRIENPRMLAIFNKYRGPKFDMLGVSIDRSKDQWKKAVMDDQLTWTQVIDESEVATNAYGVVGIPANVLVGPDGRVVAKNIFGKDLEAKLQALLVAF
jgi:peroxiredoxin